MDSLKNIASNVIRENWSVYKDIINNSPYYEILWKDLENKFNISKNDIYLPILKKFINNKLFIRKKPYLNRITIILEDNKTLILKGLDGFDRRQVHLLCDKIGLYHRSKINLKKTNKKFLYIYKPDIWLWEYTVKNPYSKSDEYYAKRESEYKIKQDQINEKLSSQYCNICNKNGLETELFHSVYIRGVYCNDCLDCVSDDDGGKLCDHKFESL
jgi:hypothetical protein